MELILVYKNIAMFACQIKRNIGEKYIKNLHVTRPIIDPIIDPSKQTSEHAFLARLSIEYRFFKYKKPIVF